jgi:hypothetical protein
VGHRRAADGARVREPRCRAKRVSRRIAVDADGRTTRGGRQGFTLKRARPPVRSDESGSLA